MNAETVHYISFSIKRILRCYPGFQSEGKQHRITRPQILETSDWETVEANILAGPRRSKMEVKIDILQAISEGAGNAPLATGQAQGPALARLATQPALEDRRRSARCPYFVGHFG